MKEKLNGILMTILSVAFMAWAGVVWQASQEVSETLNNFVLATERRLVAVEKDVEDLRFHFNRHRPGEFNIDMSKAP